MDVFTRSAREEVLEMTETVNGNRTLYTMLEMAKIAGTSKSTVYRTIKEKHIKPTKHKGQSNLYDEAVLKLVISKIEEDSVSHDPVQRISIETLQKQLEAKDKQIDQLNEQLRMAQINLSQSQQLQLKQAEQIKRLEAPQEPTGAIVSASNGKDTEESTQDGKTSHRTNEDDQGKDPKRSLWARIFGKKKKIKF